jgi:hypothetical protein
MEVKIIKRQKNVNQEKIEQNVEKLFNVTNLKKN